MLIKTKSEYAFADFCIKSECRFGDFCIKSGCRFDDFCIKLCCYVPVKKSRQEKNEAVGKFPTASIIKKDR